MIYLGFIFRISEIKEEVNMAGPLYHTLIGDYENVQELPKTEVSMEATENRLGNVDEYEDIAPAKSAVTQGKQNKRNNTTESTEYENVINDMENRPTSKVMDRDQSLPSETKEYEPLSESNMTQKENTNINEYDSLDLRS